MNSNIYIKNKLGNLINVNSRDTSINANLNATHLDLSLYLNEDEVNKFFNGEKDKITITVNTDLKNVIHSLNLVNDFDQFVNLINEYRIYIPMTSLKLLKSNFKENIDMCIEKAIDYIENITQSINYVERKAKEIKNDKGSWNLFFTRYFLVGKMPNKQNIIKAPLLFFNVEIQYIREKSQIIIAKTDDFLVLNEKLIIFLLRDANKENKLLNHFYNIKSIDDFITTVNNIIGIDLKLGSKNDLSFLNKRSKDLALIYDCLVIEDGTTFGIYEPIGGKLKQDLEEIINKNSINDIFDTNNLIPIETIENQELQDEPLIQIGKLDLYQKFAVRSSIIQNTIIHGPPGTGKSEVITNIIANILISGKSGMMVSEKKAALDVLEKRLKSLSIFMLQIYDNNDKEAFYNSIIKLDEFLGRNWLSYFNNETSIDIKSNNVYLENKRLSQNFIEHINKLTEFENFKYKEYDYIQLNKTILKFWNNIELFLDISKHRILDIFEYYKNKLNLPYKELFEMIENFCRYIVANHLSSPNIFNEFKREIDYFLKYQQEFNFDINNVDRIIQIKKYATFLNRLFENNLIAEKILKNNPYAFYNVVKIINNVKNQTIGLVHPDFFRNLNSLLSGVKSFFNLVRNCKKSDVKYFFDEFVYKNNFVNKKPFSKLFYKKKLSQQDISILECLKQIADIQIEFNDINFILNNWIYFEPIVIMYYFNNKILESKYINYIKNNFHVFDYKLFFVQTHYKFDLNKFLLTKDLIDIYQVFEQTFPEIKNYELLNTYINNLDKINWINFDLIISDYVKSLLLNKLTKLSPNDKKILEKAIHVANLKRRPGIYKYIEEYKNVLLFLFPIWSSRPEQISLYVPLEKGIFDYGIFDEASQMFLERAYPLLYRNKINIVAGDQHQLKPSSFFTSRGDDEDQEELYMDDLDVQESLLDRAKVTSWNNVMLKNHYRSEKKELIQFSNQFIYNNQLNYASINSKNNINGIDVINVEGFFNGKCNIEEANKTVELICLNCNLYKSILVITANVNQAKFIHQLIFAKEFNNQYVTKKYMDGSLSIVSIENVQGNEADFVILSMCYGRKDPDSKVYARFGPLISEGGKNRLNVAITRSKTKMVVIKSLYASDINTSNSKNNNLIVFKNFIEFLDNNERVKKQLLIDQKNKLKNEYYQFDSEFEQEVFETIKNDIQKRGLIIDTQYQVGSKKIDIVIIDPISQNVILGIEVDGWKYHCKPSKMVEDISRQKFLESRGYKIFRILEFEWKYNHDLVLQELYNHLRMYNL